jgi:hypothetical protein
LLPDLLDERFLSPPAWLLLFDAELCGACGVAGGRDELSLRNGKGRVLFWPQRVEGGESSSP